MSLRRGSNHTASRSKANRREKHNDRDSVIDVLKGAKSEIIGGLVLAVLGGLYTRFRAMRKIYIREKHELERIREEMSQLNVTKQEVERLQGLLKESEAKSQELQSQLEVLRQERERPQLKHQASEAINDDFIQLCELGKSWIVELAITYGADVNAKDNNDKTVLMLAAEKGYTEVTEVLIKHGTDLNSKDKYGYTALMWAAVKGYSEIAENLLAHGAGVNAEDNNGRTALILAAACSKRTEIAEVLLKYGANVNAKDKNDWTALMYAINNNHTEIARLLISHGAR